MHEDWNHPLLVTLWSRPGRGEVSCHVKAMKILTWVKSSPFSLGVEPAGRELLWECVVAMQCVHSWARLVFEVMSSEVPIPTDSCVASHKSLLFLRPGFLLL